MTAFLEPREGVLIARAGEEIVCPECREVLATHRQDFLANEGAIFGEALTFSSTARHTLLPGGDLELFCDCGGIPFRSNRSRTAVQHFIRSGSWSGWRGLGE